MKQIENPSAWKLSLLLIPVVVVCIAAIILNTFPGWGVVTGIVSVVAYMGAMTYFCIKQKCYEQLAQSYIHTDVGSDIHHPTEHHSPIDEICE